MSVRVIEFGASDRSAMTIVRCGSGVGGSSVCRCGLAVTAIFGLLCVSPGQDVTNRSVSTEPEQKLRPTLAAIRKYLEVKYDEVEITDDGHTVYGLAYTDAPIEEVQLSFAKRMPGTRFFKTWLEFPAYSFPRVDVLISAKAGKRGYVVRTCVSPAFDVPSKRFLYQFKRLVIRGNDEQKNFARSLTQSLAMLVPETKVSVSADSQDTYRCVISRRHDGHKWLRLLVIFHRDAVFSIRDDRDD